MGLKFQNFPKTLYFFPKCYKNDTLQGTDFSNLLFLRPNLGLVEVKKGTLTGHLPVPLFAVVPPGYVPMYFALI